MIAKEKRSMIISFFYIFLVCAMIALITIWWFNRKIEVIDQRIEKMENE